MTEGFDLHAEMVAAPDGKRWVVEARRPRVEGAGVTMLVVRTLADADAVVWREMLPPEADPVVHVMQVATTIRNGGWPGTRADGERVRARSYWSPSVLALLWLVLVTPLALLGWLRWVDGHASAAVPVVLTVVWATAGALVALVSSRSTTS
ncbi:MAG TPA: hypothetical protein VFK42_18885 [Acidimicrobiales bacterium]|nr:hypothetical protein [Acidimicrobiales bacterium]